MDYIIGVDGGGTKTEAVAYLLDGSKIAECFTGFGNMVMNSQEALENISKAIDACIGVLDQGNLLGIYFGLAGIEVSNNREIAEKFFKNKYKAQIKIFNDGELAKSAVLKGEDGILTIAGTGSICIGTNRDKTIIGGGWGHLLRDEGSGYKIAMDALKNVAHEEDFDLKRSLTTEYILRHFNFNHCKQIKNFVYSSTKNQIASLTPIVVNAANDGDMKAVEILRNNGREIAVLTEAVYRRLGLFGNIKIAIKGSVLTKVDFVRTEFENYLSNHIKDIEIINEDVSSTKGGFYEHIKYLKNREV